MEHREETIREINKLLQSRYGELGLEIRESVGEEEHSRKENKQTKQLDKVSETLKSLTCLAKKTNESDCRLG